MTTISKSQYCKGRKCLKRIWLYNYRRDLMAETSTFQENILTQGKDVGILARSLYPAGEFIHEDHTQLDAALKHTRKAMAGNASAIFEGAFLQDDVLVRVDILLRNNDGSFDLIEVKSGTSLKKKEYLPDCAVQAHVLVQSGINLRNICVAYLNNRYVKSGALDLSTLFIIQKVNHLIQDELDAVPNYLDRIKQTLANTIEPYWKLGSICKSPYTCEFKQYCWKDVPEKSIHYLYRIQDKLRFSLMGMQVELIHDIPVAMVKGAQLIQVETEIRQTPNIDREQIREHLDQLEFPLYFLDFETIGYAIPKYDGTRPYQQLTFQYSLHVQRTPGAELEHYEFLFEHNDNPMRAAAGHLLENIGETGSIIVYNKKFEAGCLRGMSNAFPDLSPRLDRIIARLWDLLVPFEKKWYCHPGFNGSASIKKVLPVLVPELSYKALGIQEGGDAQAMYLRFINENLPEAERNKIRKDLLEYCKLDSLAMVRIYEVLRNV